MSTSPTSLTSPSALIRWLVLIVAAVGFLFDTYELLMLPLVGRAGIAEVMQLPQGHPDVAKWYGNLLWMAALCGGSFGLMGGYLIDRFGRKRIMVVSILVYSLSPVLASFSTTLWMFVLFRCTTFIGVCVEFVAAITWLAELFPDKRQRELVIGWTQAFASLGGLLVTEANYYAVEFAEALPAVPFVADPFDAHAYWRYTLLTGLVPGATIMLLIWFVPESAVWRQGKIAGTLRRPSFRELFAPGLVRTTLVTAALSACAYGAAFGALQQTPPLIARGLPQVAAARENIDKYKDESERLNGRLSELNAELDAQKAAVPGLDEVVVARSSTAREIRKINEKLGPIEKELRGTPGTTLDEGRRAELQAQAKELKEQLKGPQGRMKELGGRLAEVTKGQPPEEVQRGAEAGPVAVAANITLPKPKRVVQEREETLRQLGVIRAKTKDDQDKIINNGTDSQFWQELGGLLGRILLAVLIVLIASKGTLLRIFLLPGVVLFPLVYYYCFREHPGWFMYGVFLCGLITVAQFSYFGEYLPKVFPVHLRGTGGSFATNVGGRMIGTSAAYVTANLLGPLIAGGWSSFGEAKAGDYATGAAIVGAAVCVVGLGLSFLLPQPEEGAKE